MTEDIVDKLVNRIRQKKKKRNEIARKHGHTHSVQKIDEQIQTLQRELTRATDKQLHEFDLAEGIDVFADVLHDYDQRATYWDCRDCDKRTSYAYGTPEELEEGNLKCGASGCNSQNLVPRSEDVEMKDGDDQ